MWKSLEAFYSSTKWRAFRRQIIHERTNPTDGLLYSEKSGEVIARPYDAIVHHVQELTAENVNDVSISLNPDNVIVISKREHDEIHKRFGFSSAKKVYLVEGAPCSGKTSYVLERKGNSDLVVDHDLIWQAVTGRELYFKPPALKQIVFEIYDTLIDVVRTRRGNWERAWIVTADPYPSARRRLAEKLGAEVITIDATITECLNALNTDPQGRDITLFTDLIKKYFDENG